MSRIAYIGVLTAGAVLTVVGLYGAGPEASASGDAGICAVVWCAKDHPGWIPPEERGDPTTKTTWTTSTTTSTYTTPPTTTSTDTSTSSSSSTSITSSSTSTTAPSTTTPPLSTTTTSPSTPPATTTTKPLATKTKPVAAPPHQDNRLANTGASIGWLTGLGTLLALAGALLLVLNRTRHAHRR